MRPGEIHGITAQGGFQDHAVIRESAERGTVVPYSALDIIIEAESLEAVKEMAPGRAAARRRFVSFLLTRRRRTFQTPVSRPATAFFILLLRLDIARHQPRDTISNVTDACLTPRVVKKLGRTAFPGCDGICAAFQWAHSAHASLTSHNMGQPHAHPGTS